MCSAKELDQFYTNPKLAEQLFKIIKKKIPEYKNMYFLEPSAGNGSFSNLLKDYEFSAFDLDPKQDYIVKQDFLEIKKEDILTTKKIITIGNPPFGKNSSLATKFFNQSSKISEYVCFILPKTFNKKSFINRLDRNMFLFYSKDLNKNSFLFKGQPYDVPCVFQIWKKDLNNERELYKGKTSSNLFKFTTKDQGDFAIRRVGGLAGKVLKEFDSYSPSSHYFIKSTSIDSDKLYKLINNLFLELNKTSKNTAGNPSLSKDELINFVEKQIN